MKRLTLVAAITFASSLIGCANPPTSGPSMDQKKVAVAHIQPAGAAATQPSWGKPAGTVTFTQMGDKVMIVADLTGLPAGTHGFHIHDKGDLSKPDLSSAGPHFNPDKHTHGGPNSEMHHAGDLGNIEADEKGNAHLELTATDISLGGTNDIVGKSVIVHAKADDLKTDPSGNSGARIAGGVIEMK